MNKLKMSNFMSDMYIDSMRNYFRKCNSNFKENPQNELPEGFDFDLIMLSQDFDDDLANLDSVKIVRKNIAEDKSVIALKFIYGMHLEYSLTKYKGRWVIDMIQNISKE